MPPNIPIFYGISLALITPNRPNWCQIVHGGIMNKSILLTLLAFFSVTTSCQKPPPAKNIPTPLPSPIINDKSGKLINPANLSVMAYNLENLFDHVSDNGEKPTPIDVLEKKLSQVAKGILQIRGVGPDILFVSEVENLNVLKMLNEKYLKGAGYQTVALIDSDDERGIDVGVFSRLALIGEPVLHKMPFSDVNTTRGILEVTLEIAGGKTVKAFANHFPSQSNPVTQRREAAQYLLSLMNKAQADYVIAGGDFNITTKEESEQKIFGGILQDLDITHLKGCEGCLGTYNYRGRWDFLDAILVREKNVLLGSTVRIPNKASGQLNADKTPKRFDKATGTGISDHLPIYVELLL